MSTFSMINSKDAKAVLFRTVTNPDGTSSVVPASKCCGSNGWLEKWLKKPLPYIKIPPKQVMSVVEAVCCATNLVVWACNTYDMGVSVILTRCNYILFYLFIITTLSQIAVQPPGELLWHYTINAFTPFNVVSIPVLLYGGFYGYWFTFAHWRGLRLLTAWDEIDDIVEDLFQVTRLQMATIGLIVTLLTIIFFMGGTVFMLEVLGDPTT